MPITHSKTMLVRLPVEIAEQLIKLRNDKNLSTIGVALKYWIEQERNGEIETRLNLIEEQIKKMTKILDIMDPDFSKIDKLFHRLLDALFKMDKRTEKRLNCLEANQLQKVK